jgi:hypothetical protein
MVIVVLLSGSWVEMLGVVAGLMGRNAGDRVVRGRRPGADRQSGG